MGQRDRRTKPRRVLNLSQRETEAVKFLVHKHLMMSHLAFRRDTSDDQIVLRFAVEVGSPELLQMLFVMSCADLAAVGPGVLNDWKIQVLTDLYERALGIWEEILRMAPAASKRSVATKSGVVFPTNKRTRGLKALSECCQRPTSWPTLPMIPRTR